MNIIFILTHNLGNRCLVEAVVGIAVIGLFAGA